MKQSGIDERQIARVVLTLLERGEAPADVAQKVAAYLISEGYSGRVDMLVRSLEQVMRHTTGTLEVNVRSRHELSEEVRTRIIQLFQDAERVTLSEQLDPTLLGGARIVAGDEVLDVSVRSRINALKQAVKV